MTTLLILAHQFGVVVAASHAHGMLLHVARSLDWLRRRDLLIVRRAIVHMQQVSSCDLTIGRLHRQHDKSGAIRVTFPVLIHLIEVMLLRG